MKPGTTEDDMITSGSADRMRRLGWVLGNLALAASIVATIYGIDVLVSWCF